MGYNVRGDQAGPDGVCSPARNNLQAIATAQEIAVTLADKWRKQTASPIPPVFANEAEYYGTVYIK